ncbi:AI-2E family transporter [Virgisporangium aurantiacum]|uniref:AI-2E family transporter n=1 Tax=Virgisporangium aurantiacum TaxID=175570 RepID=A0A8J3ZGX3_9ACTN|nr:AI-2E family transporter [Virgisporangium aurantiacum]GIJ61371.1 AI-2E family transporter [Virgisporangium aurantiacum]
MTADSSAEEILRREPAGGAPPVDEGPPGRVGFGQVYRWGIAAALGVLSVALAAFAVYAVRSVLVLVIIALFIAVGLDPAVRWLVRRGFRRGVAVGIIFLAAFGMLAGFLAAVIPPLLREGGDLFTNLPGYVERLPEQSSLYRDLAERYHFTEKLSQYAANIPQKLVGNAWGFARQFLGALASVLTVLVFTIYFMADLPRLRRGLVRLFPRPRRPQAAEVVNVVVEKVGAYMVGNLIVSLVAGFTSFVVLMVLGVPYALPLAVAVAITDLIPLVGATIGAVLVTAITFFTSDLWPETVVVIIFFVVYQQLENYILVPRVMRNTVDISSIAVLLSALVGATVMGVMGALMAIPIAAAVKVVLTPMIERHTESAPPAVPAQAPAPREPDTASE